MLPVGPRTLRNHCRKRPVLKQAHGWNGWTCFFLQRCNAVIIISHQQTIIYGEFQNNHQEENSEGLRPIWEAKTGNKKLQVLARNFNEEKFVSIPCVKSWIQFSSSTFVVCSLSCFHNLVRRKKDDPKRPKAGEFGAFPYWALSTQPEPKRGPSSFSATLDDVVLHLSCLRDCPCSKMVGNETIFPRFCFWKYHEAVLFWVCRAKCVFCGLSLAHSCNFQRCQISPLSTQSALQIYNLKWVCNSILGKWRKKNHSEVLATV